LNSYNLIDFKLEGGYASELSILLFRLDFIIEKLYYESEKEEQRSRRL